MVVALRILQGGGYGSKRFAGMMHEARVGHLVAPPYRGVAAQGLDRAGQTSELACPALNRP